MGTSPGPTTVRGRHSGRVASGCTIWVFGGRPQPDADAQDRLQDLALGWVPGRQHPATRPNQLVEFIPSLLGAVMLEDPRLSSDPDTGRGEKVVMWSHPIIKNGVIYVVQRKGLYVPRLQGALEHGAKRIGFLEGNSNPGDALCFEPMASNPTSCD